MPHRTASTGARVLNESETRALVAGIFADAFRPNPMRDPILDLVRREFTPTLAAVAKLPGGSGDAELVVGNTNVALWGRLSAVAVNAIIELVGEGLVRVEPCHALVYLAEGSAPGLPLATERGVARGYRTKHWLPVVVTLAGPE